MTIEFTRVPNAGATTPEELVAALQVIGKLQRPDFDLLGSRLKVLLEQHGKLRLLVELVDFEGWSAGGAWEDVKFAVEHFDDIERIAVVGDARWEKGITVLAKPFTRAEVRYYDAADKGVAEAWLHES